ncbi:MAG: hypothetical protein M0T76_05755 [Desulfobacteraceae bacterium]|nr:hypothetical protein [Desulfobacteraceae bacterium]
MAQIKSTMEMVLARADRLCAEAETASSDDDLRRRGMKIGAALMNGEAVDLAAAIRQCPPPALPPLAQGLLDILFRNLVLPREEGQPWEAALHGIVELAKALPQADKAQLSGLVAEVRSILSRYLQHRQQLEKQLEEGFALQTAQLQQSLAQQTGMKMKISPRQHPKFQEEWQRVQAQLNDQYLAALDQYKEAISGLLGL